MNLLADTYRNRRIALGLTQDQAAAKAGVARRTLVDFETGGEGISVANLRRLMNAVGLEIAAREQASRPTLDELSERYQGADTPVARKRARPKKTAT